MANVSNPRGLIPVRYRSGSPYNAAANMYYVPASDGTALFIGDLVKGVTASADANGVPTVTRAAAGDYTLGPVVGVVSYRTKARLQSDPTYRVASTEAYVLVADDPDLMFEVEENGAMVAGAGGRNAEFVVASGNTTSGYSGTKLNSSTLNTTNTLTLRIHKPVDREDNVFAGGALKWLVSINLHALRNLTGV